MCQEFSRYFPDLQVIDLVLVRNPFNVEPDIVPDSDQYEFLEIKFDSVVKNFLKEHHIQELWPEKMYHILESGSLL